MWQLFERVILSGIFRMLMCYLLFKTAAIWVIIKKLKLTRAWKLLFIGLICLATFCFVNGVYPHSQLYGEFIWHGNRNIKSVAITFDDGPHPIYTPAILRILKAKNIKATFFMVGKQVEHYPEVAVQVIKLDNEIGSHSYSHSQMLIKTNKKIIEEIERTEAAIIAATGYRPKLFRPPYGFKSPLCLWLLKKYGYRVIGWSISSRDWAQPDVDNIAKRLSRKVKDADILLFHDTNPKTVQALPIIIDILKIRGFRFYTVSELLAAEK